MRVSFVQGLCAVCMTCVVAVVPTQVWAQSASSGVPDIAGVRTGMTAQQAYEALKGHVSGARIAIGQNTVDGVTATPVPDLMAVKLEDKVPMETANVWLTTPPSKQVVWAVGQTMTYPEANKILKSTVVNALRKKFGPETSSQSGVAYYWAFDQQGGPANMTASSSNCVNAQNFSVAVVEPSEPTFTYVTPLIYPISPKSPCDALVDVRVQLNGPNNAAEYVTAITLTEVDHSLVRSTKETYNAYRANAGVRQHEQELEKAKDQKGPVF